MATRLATAHDGPFCGAKTRAGTLCRQPAGWGTDHGPTRTRRGEGRCKLHGGRNPIKHGRYSTIERPRVRELAEEFENDPSPLDLLPELAQARALYTDYLERFETFQAALLAWHKSYVAGKDDPTKKPRQILDPADAMRLLSEVTKIAKRMEDIRAHNAISRADFYRILMEMGRVVDANVTDEDLREKIRHGWLEIRLS